MFSLSLYFATVSWRTSLSASSRRSLDLLTVADRFRRHFRTSPVHPPLTFSSSHTSRFPSSFFPFCSRLSFPFSPFLQPFACAVFSITYTDALRVCFHFHFLVAVLAVAPTIFLASSASSKVYYNNIRFLSESGKRRRDFDGELRLFLQFIYRQELKDCFCLLFAE